ncbi:hypothetical protein LZ32DRAFT_609550 [Colletotrichum eremochloae]|nr:hypothetical protein LZ32DRAFT_609550 [Colletotrichum eremochloae]
MAPGTMPGTSSTTATFLRQGLLCVFWTLCRDGDKRWTHWLLHPGGAHRLSGPNPPWSPSTTTLQPIRVVPPPPFSFISHTRTHTGARPRALSLLTDWSASCSLPAQPCGGGGGGGGVLRRRHRRRQSTIEGR